MDLHTVAEESYKNGYKKGYEDGKRNAVGRGRWKAHKPDCRGYTNGFVYLRCGATVYADYSMKECDYNYCPFCGADMRE